MNKKLVDLSYPIDRDIKVHPLDTPAFLIHEQYLEKNQYNQYRLEIGLHTGTHIDAPMHMIQNEKYISDYNLELFCGPAVLIDVRGENIISLKENYDDIIDKNSIVLFYTGHDRNYGKDEYFTDHPVLDAVLAEFLVSKQIKMTGFDLPSPDRPPYEIHKILLGGDIMIIENLKNLNELINRKFELYAFPLNIKSDSSLVRAVANMI
jgi:kynurenine formamidase